MKLFQGFACIAALTTLALVGSAGSAQAINFKVTNGMAGLNGETNQGAFSDFSRRAGVKTIDFNNGSAPTTGFAKYSFVGNGDTSVRSDMWAPVGANGEKNTSKYLEVFSGKKVVIDLQNTLNYFGINWGAAHAGNTYSFMKKQADGTYKAVKTFLTSDIEKAGGFAIYSALHPGSGEGAKDGKQGNGFVHFYSEGSNDNFDRIEISQSGGGGFETDNHSFNEGTGAFDIGDKQAVPEPGVAVGLLTLGGMFLLKRNGGKQVQEATQA